LRPVSAPSAGRRRREVGKRSVTHPHARE
jgi:hypothetical protein